MNNDPNYMHLVWNQIRDRGGMQVAPVDLRTGDAVTVTGTGVLGGLIQKFAAVSGRVTRAGWSGNRFKFTVHVEEYTVLSPSFWSSPYVEFEHPLVERVVKYSV